MGVVRADHEREPTKAPQHMDKQRSSAVTIIELRDILIQRNLERIDGRI